MEHITFWCKFVPEYDTINNLKDILGDKAGTNIGIIMGLTKNTLKKIDNSNTVKGMLADLFKRDIKTINRYVVNNDELLCHIVAVEIYEKHLGISKKEAIEYSHYDRY